MIRCLTTFTNFDMEAPNKIYVTIDRPNERIEYNPELVGVAWSKKDKSCEHIEYIRKDALLEWLESKVYKHNEDRFDDGFNAALGQVIDKINAI